MKPFNFPPIPFFPFTCHLALIPKGEKWNLPLLIPQNLSSL